MKTINTTFEFVGAVQCHIGIPINDGPCFQHPWQARAWAKGWRSALASQCESFRNTGVLQFNIGVPLEDGPCFQHPWQARAFVRGWRSAGAFYEGHRAGMDGNRESDNPYSDDFCKTVITRYLAKVWEKGYRAARFIIEH